MKRLARHAAMLAVVAGAALAWLGAGLLSWAYQQYQKLVEK